MEKTGDHQAVRRSLRLYGIVGLLLFCGTIATVLVATVPWLDVGRHGLDGADVILGLLIASTKALLVAAVFMHLNHERRLIYFLIGLAFVHCIGMIAFSLFCEIDLPWDPGFYHEGRSQSSSTIVPQIATGGAGDAAPGLPAGREGD